MIIEAVPETERCYEEMSKSSLYQLQSSSLIFIMVLSFDVTIELEAFLALDYGLPSFTSCCF